MDAARYDKLQSIFEEPRHLSPAERAAHLDTACGANAALRDEVEALLRALSAREHTAHALSDGRIEKQRRAIEQFGGAKPPPGLPERIGTYRVTRRIAFWLAVCCA